MKLHQIIAVFGLTLLNYSITLAQSNEVEYYYDGGGNRVQRSISVTQKSLTHDSITDLKNDYKFRVFPNTTDDVLTVEVDQEFLELAPSELKLYDLSGKLLITKQFAEASEILSLAHLASGPYLLRITASNNRSADWRVIKR